MIAPPIDPAGKADTGPHVLLAKFATGMGAVGVH
jgi:hypothetical protein